jgi:hypothetical protein
LVDCTNKAHRAALVSICDQIGTPADSRASIDDVLALLLATSPQTIALDNIDRAPRKMMYSLLSLSTVHTIYATATTRKQLAPLLERQGAIIVPVPPLDLGAIVRAHHPTLDPAAVRRIVSTASTPAAALHIAQAGERGEPIPAPPSKPIIPLLAIVMLAGITYLRADTEAPAVVIALVSGIAYYIRRVLWRNT